MSDSPLFTEIVWGAVDFPQTALPLVAAGVQRYR